jgi:hypothetical protein
MSDRNSSMIDRIWSMSDSMWLACQRRLVTLEEIVQFIRSGDAHCIDNLMITVENTMAAWKKAMYVEAVVKLNCRCRLIRSRLRELEFRENSALEALFERLDQYVTTDLRKQLH